MRGERVHRGFTLIELLITLAVLAIIVAVIVPSLTGIDRRKARLGVDQVEDLLSMYAYRDSTGAQQVALAQEEDTGGIGVWIKDLPPENESGLAEWVEDRFSPPLMLSDVVWISDVRVDGRRQGGPGWFISRVPNSPRPLIEIDLEGADTFITLVLSPDALTPTRVERRVLAIAPREPVDLDQAGLEREDW